MLSWWIWASSYYIACKGKYTVIPNYNTAKGKDFTLTFHCDSWRMLRSCFGSILSVYYRMRTNNDIYSEIEVGFSTLCVLSKRLSNHQRALRSGDFQLKQFKLCCIFVVGKAWWWWKNMKVEFSSVLYSPLRYFLVTLLAWLCCASHGDSTHVFQ